MEVVEQIQTRLKKAVRELYGVELTEIGVEHPQNPLWGDYSSNVALINAKKVGKNPIDMAKELAENLMDLSSGNAFNKIQVAGPGFINFSLSNSYYLSQMDRVIKETDDFGKAVIGQGKKIALEHSNVNPNKAAHIGHLRNAVIGQFVERVYEFIGYNVVVQYYANDLGVQVSTSLLGTKKLSNVIDKTKYKKFDHYMWDVYSKISQQIDTDEKLKEELNLMMAKLDARDPSISKEQEEVSKRVLKDNMETFSRLGIDYDLIVYESAIKDTLMWEETFIKLRKNTNVYLATEGTSVGCWLVKMSTKEDKEASGIEEDKIIVRSNGIPTYTGKDIAYHMWKFGLLEVDFKYNLISKDSQGKTLYDTDIKGDSSISFADSNIVIDVIDVRQTYAIDAVRKSLEYLGFKEQSDNLIHVNYGHVYLSRKTALFLGYDVSDEVGQVAMSGRKGIGIKIDDFIDMVDKSLSDAHGNFPNAKDIRNSAIKFDILRYDTFQDVVFDIDNALNFKGFTGPYVQYTHARASSLLEKAGYAVQTDSLDCLLKKFSDLILGDSTISVLQSLYIFPEIVLESAKNYAPNTMCVYLYDLCQKFNSFYNDSPIINAETSELKEFRLLLTASTKQVIKNGLYLLGITAVDKM